MTDDRIAAARTFGIAYAAGDTEELLSVLAEDWALHDADGTRSGHDELVDITDKSRVGFPEKQVEFLHELLDERHVAQHVWLTLVHSGRFSTSNLAANGCSSWRCSSTACQERASRRAGG